MATYKSSHKGSQIDNAVSVANDNLNRGDSETPIYYDSEGLGQAVQKDSTATVSSVKPLTSGGAYTGLNAVVDNSDIQTSTSLGTSDMPPSQNAVKQYVDNSLPAKQDTLYGGYGIDVNGATVSVSDDVFREDEEARLHADLKVDHFGDMSVGNDSEVLELMNEARHSSFDRSKFTVAGSPNITDDGIASGFSVYTDKFYNNALTDISASQLSTDGNWSFKCSFTLPSSNPNRTEVAVRCPYGAYGFIDVNSAYQVIDIQPFNTIIRTINDSDFAWGSTYDIEVIFNGANSKVKVKKDGVALPDTSFTLPTSPVAMGGTSFTFGSYSADSEYYKSFSGSIDLKQFSITVDGVEVFSGNKTGIDTIKPDDYQVVGTPTISADGIASGFSTTNYLTITTPVLTSNNFSFKGTVNITNRVGTGNFPILYMGTEGDRMSLAYQDSKFTLASGNSHFTFLQTSNYTQNGLYYYEVKVENNVVYLLISDDNGQTYITLNTPLTSPFSGSYSLRLGNSGTDYFSIGSIDLNAFKIYVDGNLVYQPCLKIPYTQTKDGKKIVDSIYRSRVEDEYGQAGFTPYYTLQEEDKGNYEVVGSPTISSDFIVSGFSGSNYIIPNYQFDMTTANSWVVVAKVNPGTFSSQPYQAIYASKNSDGSNREDRLGFQGTGKLNLMIGFSDNSFVNFDGNKVFTENEDVFIKAEFTGSAYNTYYSYDGINWTLDGTAASSQKGVNRTRYIGTTTISGFQYLFRGSIDLKEFKIYVDNKLAYEAVIPPNYTMATVEEDDIVASLDGATSYAQRADLSIEQQGTTTNGTAVTFPKAFMDTNYALSIPYSAKTKTGFTAAADGDYIAEGNVLI